MDTSHRVTELPQEVADASAVQMLLNLQSSASKQKTQQAVPSTIRPGSLELRQVTRTTAGKLSSSRCLCSDNSSQQIVKASVRRRS